MWPRKKQQHVNLLTGLFRLLSTELLPRMCISIWRRWLPVILHYLLRRTRGAHVRKQQLLSVRFLLASTVTTITTMFLSTVQKSNRTGSGYKQVVYCTCALCLLSKLSAQLSGFRPNVVQTSSVFPANWLNKMQMNARFHPPLLCKYKELNASR